MDEKYYFLKKLENERSKHKVICRCGTKTIMTDVDKTICRGCGHWIYKNKKIEFKERIKNELRRNRNTN